LHHATQALELAPFLEALLGSVGGLLGSVGGVLPGLRVASSASSSAVINVYFTVNRIGGEAGLC
jgi:hypothetical protein